MLRAPLFDSSSATRDLIRTMRRGVFDEEENGMPESLVWQVFLELRKRGNPDAHGLFISTLKQLHSRRALGAVSLPVDDGSPDEHRLVEDAFLADDDGEGIWAIRNFGDDVEFFVADVEF